MQKVAAGPVHSTSDLKNLLNPVARPQDEIHEISGLDLSCPFSGEVFMEKLALLTPENPAAFRLDQVNSTKEPGCGEVFEQEWAEALISASITSKIQDPALGRFKTIGEFGGTSSDLTTATAVGAPASLSKRFLGRAHKLHV